MTPKTLLIATLTATILTNSAYASDVEIYGTLHYAWDFVNSHDVNGDQLDDATGVNHASLIGFSSWEDLGNGVKASFTIETDIGSALGSNNTFVALDGPYGTWILGRLDTPYKTATIDWNMWADTVGDYNAIIGSDATGASNFEVLAQQTALWISPVFSGTQLAIARIAIKNTSVGNDDQAWSLSASYNNGPLSLVAAYEIHQGPNLGLGSSATADEEAWKLGGSYNLGNGTLAAIYEDVDHDDKTTRQSREAWWLSYRYELGNNTFGVSYAQSTDSDLSGADDGAKQITLGLSHTLSPRTSVYLLSSSVMNDAQGMWGLNGAGLYNAAAAGRNISALSLGLMHEF